jgi:hypothetical protein
VIKPYSDSKRENLNAKELSLLFPLKKSDFMTTFVGFIPHNKQNNKGLTPINGGQFIPDNYDQGN